MARLVLAFVLLYIFSEIKCSRILAVYPTPSISHQLSFRQFTLELIKRGHEVVVLTTDLAFPNGGGPANLTEIDVRDISYDLWRETFGATASGKMADLPKQLRAGYEVMLPIMVRQLQLPSVQKVVHNTTFDLLILEAWVRPALIFAHFHKVPVIQISSFGAFFAMNEAIGAPNHPLIYPIASRQRINNPTLWEKVLELYLYYSIYYEYLEYEKVENGILRDNFAPDMPDLSVLLHNVDMTFYNVYSIWDSNRPVPPNVVYIGGIHHMQSQKLPEELETYLNSSQNGVIYMSFGTNVNPSSLPAHQIQKMVNVFSQLPYDVLWKWDKDVLPGRTKNIRIEKWLPQPDLLKHPKINLFITQAGLQSSDEAVAAGVPLLGIPIIADQWYNAGRYVQLKIGLQLGIETLTEDQFKRNIVEVIENPSYKENILKLRNMIHDQPQSALDRAVWWTEHVLRHGGAKHLRAAGAGITWAKYLEFDLVFIFLTGVLIVLGFLASLICFMYKLVVKLLYRKLKQN